MTHEQTQTLPMQPAKLIAQFGRRLKRSRRPGPKAGARERREFLRWPVFWSAKLADNQGSRDCMVLDFSPGGARLRTARAMAIGTRVTLGFPYAGQFGGKVVWRNGNFLGVRFGCFGLGDGESGQHDSLEACPAA